MVRNLNPRGTVLNSVTSRLLACASLTAVALGAPACVMNVDHEGTIERVEKRFTVEKIAELHLYTFDGAIEVRSWDRPEVVVQIEKRGQDKDAVAKIEILSEQKGDRLQVEARHTAKTRLCVGRVPFAQRPVDRERPEADEPCRAHRRRQRRGRARQRQRMNPHRRWRRFG